MAEEARDAAAQAATAAEALLPEFKLESVLNQDQAGRRIMLLGSIHDEPALLILERAPFPSSETYLARVPSTLQMIKNLGANDVYFWYLANSYTPRPAADEAQDGVRAEGFADLKINLIYPCTEQHVLKYRKQKVRLVEETPEIYRDAIRPLMMKKREGGRLNWVWNIIEGKTEVEDVIYRTKLGDQPETGFLLLPDLNWDRKTLEALHLLAVVERRDIWSLRDLKKKHIPWLKQMRAQVIESTVASYEGKGLETDQLKLYVHYQPTYYHFHIHVVHVQLEAGATQATGKAIGLESIISQLETMGGDDEAGMDQVTLCYTVGTSSELWTTIFEPQKLSSAGLAGTAFQLQSPDR